MSGGSHYSSLNSLLSPHSLKRSRSNVNDEDSASSIISVRNTHISIIFSNCSARCYYSTFNLAKMLFCSWLWALLWWWWYSLSLNLCNFSSSFIAHVHARGEWHRTLTLIYITHIPATHPVMSFCCAYLFSCSQSKHRCSLHFIIIIINIMTVELFATVREWKLFLLLCILFISE